MSLLFTREGYIHYHRETRVCALKWLTVQKKKNKMKLQSQIPSIQRQLLLPIVSKGAIFTIWKIDQVNILLYALRQFHLLLRNRLRKNPEERLTPVNTNLASITGKEAH